MYTFTVNVRRRCKSANWRAERGDGRGGPGHSPGIYIESEIPVEQLHEVVQGINPNPGVSTGHPSKSMS